MDKMKDSGFDWIDKIPNEWYINRFRYVYSIKKAKLPNELFDENDEKMKPYMTMEYIRDTNNITPEYAKEGTYCKANEILLLWEGANAGEIIYRHPEGYAPSTTAILTLTKNLNKEYSKYYLKFIEDKLREITNGIRIPHVDGLFLRNLPVIIPNLQEQILIAKFLEYKMTKINEILKDLNNQIEILNKYKKSLITETVTKELSLNVEMKECGIPWIAKIPSHWQIKKLKYLGTARNGLTYSPDDQVDSGILVLRSSNIQDAKVLLDDNVYVDMKIPRNLVLKENDLLI